MTKLTVFTCKKNKKFLEHCVASARTNRYIFIWSHHHQNWPLYYIFSIRFLTKCPYYGLFQKYQVVYEQDQKESRPDRQTRNSELLKCKGNWTINLRNTWKLFHCNEHVVESTPIYHSKPPSTKPPCLCLRVPVICSA
jgi:hypothetical protein